MQYLSKVVHFKLRNLHSTQCNEAWEAFNHFANSAFWYPRLPRRFFMFVFPWGFLLDFVSLFIYQIKGKIRLAAARLLEFELWFIFTHISFSIGKVKARAFCIWNQYDQTWNDLIHQNKRKVFESFFQGCAKCLYCMKIAAMCECTEEDKVTDNIKRKS